MASGREAVEIKKATSAQMKPKLYYLSKTCLIDAALNLKEPTGGALGRSTKFGYSVKCLSEQPHRCAILCVGGGLTIWNNSRFLCGLLLNKM